MKVYIDIDGVLLTNDLSIPEYGLKFINFLTENFECFWLTTHCRTGENKSIEYLERFYSEDAINKLKKIKTTDWVDKKTEAIDFNSEFIWLDDSPFNFEKQDLIKRERLESLIVVNLNKEKELLHIENQIRKTLGNTLCNLKAD